MAVALLLAGCGGPGTASRRQAGSCADPPTTSPTAEAPAAQWAPLPPSPLTPRFGHSAIWTGHEVLFWGGWDGGRALSDGAAYDPERRVWRCLPEAPLTGRQGHAAVWTGEEMVVLGGWGGSSGRDPARGAGAYDPATASWRALPEPPFREGPVSATLGGRVIFVVAGAVVAEYNPGENRWIEHRDAPLLPFRDVQRSPEYRPHWIAARLVVWGSVELPDAAPSHGAVYDGTHWEVMPANGMADGDWTGASGGDRLVATRAKAAMSYSPSERQWRPERSPPRHLLDVHVAESATSVWFVQRLGSTVTGFVKQSGAWKAFVPEHPLSPRHSVGVAAGQSWLVLWGGADRQNRPLGDGAALQVEQD